MKYNYPYKEWLGGGIFFLMISLWGVYLLYDISVKLIYFIGYIACCYLLVDWYWNKIQMYRSKYVKINDEAIEFTFHNNQEVRKYTIEDIEYIFNCDHIQRLKKHNVVHFFMKNGDYYYLTNEIDKYSKIKKNLQKNFSIKYFIIEECFHGVLEGDKKELFLDKIKEINTSV